MHIYTWRLIHQPAPPPQTFYHAQITFPQLFIPLIPAPNYCINNGEISDPSGGGETGGDGGRLEETDLNQDGQRGKARFVWRRPPVKTLNEMRRFGVFGVFPSRSIIRVSGRRRTPSLTSEEREVEGGDGVWHY